MTRLATWTMALAVFGTMSAGADDFKQRFPETRFERLSYNHPGLVVDLGVGLWAYPLPVDFDGDGDHDLLVASPDVPYNGIYFFENVEGNVKYPVFKPGQWLCPAPGQLTVSHLDGAWRILSENRVFGGIQERNYEPTATIEFEPNFYHEGRDRQWKLCDYNGDGLYDLVIGASDWREYGWDDAYNEKGEWTRGPLHGHVYVALNTGSNDAPKYERAFQVMAGDKPVDVYGAPSPNFADFDGDGDLDLVCGEFLDKLTYFENTGTRTEPRYRPGRYLQHEGQPIRMDLEMLQVAAIDWDRDGDTDLVVGQEDGRVALLEHTGSACDGMPAFLPPRFFQQEADALKVGALATPYSVDWDDDGDADLIVGDTAGYLSFVENLDGGDPPKWAAPVYLTAGGEIVRIQAGPNGSIQGPAEAKWGYTVCSVADWDRDRLPDIVVNSIWGEVLWYRNAGARSTSDLEPARPIEVEWEGAAPKPEWLWWTPRGKKLVTQWRTRPQVIDLNGDGLHDLVMLDAEGYLAYFERARREGVLVLLPPQRIFLRDDGAPLRLSERQAGGSGRRKFTLADWDGDGRIDILLNSVNIDFLRNVGTPDKPWTFRNEGPVDSHKLAGHDTCPTIVDWDRNGIPDLLVGAEDGFFYYLKNPRARDAAGQ
jgi:hypothetical protein